MEDIREDEKGSGVNKKAPDLKKASSRQDGTTTIVGSRVDDAGFRRQLGKRQIMMMTFGAGIGTGLWARIPLKTTSECSLTLARSGQALLSNTPVRVALQL